MFRGGKSLLAAATFGVRVRGEETWVRAILGRVYVEDMRVAIGRQFHYRGRAASETPEVSPILSQASGVRPESPGEPKPLHRDWIFLFECSGDREPRVAGAQVEIVEAILNSAEPDDTFMVLAVNTCVEPFSGHSQAASADNAGRAVGFLERLHLVGASTWNGAPGCRSLRKTGDEPAAGPRRIGQSGPWHPQRRRPPPAYPRRCPVYRRRRRPALEPGDAESGHRSIRRLRRPPPSRRGTPSANHGTPRGDFFGRREEGRDAGSERGTRLRATIGRKRSGCRRSAANVHRGSKGIGRQRPRCVRSASRRNGILRRA